jgi:UDP-GlcNAc:undecaprenyl-phosphate/decaprenyl-phosphate GlcNAc-1-phosphate transferase
MTTQVLILHLIFTFILFLVSIVLTRFMLRRVRIMDTPNGRSSHESPMPTGGGIAIVAAFFIGLIAIFLFTESIRVVKWPFLGFVVASLLLACVSLYDDIKSKPFIIKLSAQFIAVLIVLIFGIIIDQISLPVMGLVYIGWLAYPVTFIWIIGLTNAFNFMDGLDGLAGGVAIIVAIFFCVITCLMGSDFVYIICYTLVAGSLGFLVYNRPPARIFMGDVGSTFLGFTFAVISVMAARYDMSHTSFFVMPLLLFNFIYDTLFTFMRRLCKGERVIDAHHTHLYQLFQQLGYSHWTVSAFHYAVAILQGLAALWMVHSTSDKSILVFLPFLLFQVIYTVIIIHAAKRKALI